MSIHESHSLNWDDLKYFLAVARTGTLRGGADSIQVNHTTLTRRLSVMEERVGSRLFDRSKQGLVLTQLGEDLMPHAERVEAEMISAFSCDRGAGRPTIGKQSTSHFRTVWP